MLKFLCDAFSQEHAEFVLFGVPLGKKSKRTLETLRKVSRLVEPFDMNNEKNLLEDVSIADIGDLKLRKLDEVYEETKKIVNKGKIPVILGGEHLLTLYAAGAMKENTKIVVFDAHCDLKDSYLGTKYNNATWLRRLCESIGTRNIALVGVRSCEQDELEFMKENKIFYIMLNEIGRKNLEEFVKDSDIYLSIDMDVFDPSIAPAVENPEPDGLTHEEFLRLIEPINKIVCLDFVEIASFEEDRTTEFFAVKVLFELFSKIKHRYHKY
jgi:agmatinase